MLLCKEKIGSGPAALRFAGEFIAGINRIQYNQGNGISALAGMPRNHFATTAIHFATTGNHLITQLVAGHLKGSMQGHEQAAQP